MEKLQMIEGVAADGCSKGCKIKNYSESSCEVV